MGCMTSTRYDPEMEKKNKIIEQQLRQDRKIEPIKLLLLGAGDSGKSTIAKQIKIIHMSGFTKDELLNFKPVVHNNAITCIKLLLLGAQKFNYTVETKNEPASKFVSELNPLKSLTQDCVKHIQALWKDKAIKKAYARRNEFQLLDICEYAMENLERIGQPDYIPTEEDVLRCRARTSGIVETCWSVDGIDFRMVDVGGQRSERKKWIHCFQDVTGLIFCVALSEYDQKLYEDESVNRMHESFQLFEQIANSKWFSKTPIILFLNKSDLFQEKIVQKDLKVCFPEYSGGKDFINATTYITKKLVSLRRTDAVIYTHITCATDTENINFVFKAVKDVVIFESLDKSGF